MKAFNKSILLLIPILLSSVDGCASKKTEYPAQWLLILAGQRGGDPDPSYTVGGSVSGLAGSELRITNNGSDEISIASDGAFLFPMSLRQGSSYDVQVSSQPIGPAQTCTASNNIGIINGATVSDVRITCPAPPDPVFSIGGAVSGLIGTGLRLTNNGGDKIPIGGDGSFSFPTALADGTAYNVQVSAQPIGPGQTCSATGNIGTVNGANVKSVQIICSVNSYTVGGSVNGLSGTLVLRLNGGNDSTITLPGLFTFTNPLSTGSAYDVMVASNPVNPGQTCAVTNGSGTMGSSNVTDVVVNCTTNTHLIGGTVTGLAGSGLRLTDNGADEIAIAGDGIFTFPAPLNDGANYAVAVSFQPMAPDQTCRISNNTGIVSGADVTGVSVICYANSYGLIINEVDYDNIGTDGAEFVELYNNGISAVNLAGHTLVLVNGLNGSTYRSVDLAPVGTVQPGEYLVIGSSSVIATLPVTALRIDLGGGTDYVQNGSPDGIAIVNALTGTLIDALSYEGSITTATVTGIPGPASLVEGAAISGSVADSNTVAGSLCRQPNGVDTNYAAGDWQFSSTTTPGLANAP